MRKRMIDPGYWSDDKVIELDHMQRLLFIGMWNFADDAGVLRNSSKQIKAQIFPADDITNDVIVRSLEKLYVLGLIILNKDKTLIKIKGWSDYQKINRPQPSKYEFEVHIEETTDDSVNVHGMFTPNRSKKKLVEVSIDKVSIIEKNTSKNLSVQTDKEFELFYDMYPRKVSKQATIRAFRRLTKKEKALAIETLPKHIKYWNENDIQLLHIKHPSSWINGKHWEDELDAGSLKVKISEEFEERKRRERNNELRELDSKKATVEEKQEALKDWIRDARP